MKFFVVTLPRRPGWLLLAGLALAGCAKDANVSLIHPRFHPVRAAVGDLARVESGITHALTVDRSAPLPALAEYLAAAETASQQLARDPHDEAARDDYNFAVARIVTTFQRANANPWSQPLRVHASGGDYTVSHVRDPRPDHDPALYDFTPSDEFDVDGLYVKDRTVKPGVGAPLVAVGKAKRTDAAETFTADRTYYGVTALVVFHPGRRCEIVFRDPLHTETVQLGGKTFPLAGDFTVPLAVALARANPDKTSVARTLNPEKYAETARVARLQPYEPDKTVVLLVHGLVSSPATWAPMLNTLRSDPEVRKHYQFWFYSYPSGYPYPYSAALLRHQLDAIEKRYPLRHKMILVGHSMGSLIARLMITDTGDKLWLTYFGKPPSETKLSPETRAKLEDAVIFRHRSEVGRIIFISGPHRGSELATGWVGRFASRLIRAPATLLALNVELRKVLVEDKSALRVATIPNSVDTLAPNNRFVRAINTIPLTPGIPYHSIMGDRGKGGNKDHTRPVSSDGVVPYWSSHLDGAQSELIVPSNHGAHQNPQAIAEVDRILRQEAGLPPRNRP